MTPVTALQLDDRSATATLGYASPRARRPALLGSLLLHAVLVLFLLHRVGPDGNKNIIKFFPVELVTLADRTTAPVPPKADLPRQQTASVRPQIKKSPPPSMPLTPPQQNPAAPVTGAEPVPLPPKDELQSRLDAFSKLTVPGTGTIAVTGYGLAAGPSSYDLKDFIRAQVERHWSVDLDSIEDRRTTVAIHVVLTPDGVVRKAEIVSDRRGDAEYHWLAISARNAVLLSSPVALPAGLPASALDVVLNLSPTDALK
jgi:hypothetical protein